MASGTLPASGAGGVLGRSISPNSGFSPLKPSRMICTCVASYRTAIQVFGSRTTVPVWAQADAASASAIAAAWRCIRCLGVERYLGHGDPMIRVEGDRSGGGGQWDRESLVGLLEHQHRDRSRSRRRPAAAAAAAAPAACGSRGGSRRLSDSELEGHLARFAGLVEGDLELLVGGIVFPRARDVHDAAAVEPFGEVPAQVAFAGIFHGVLEIEARRIGVAKAAVVKPDAGPEVVVADHPAQHVQHLRAALVDLGIVGDHLADVAKIAVDDGRVRVRLRIAAGLGGARFDALQERIPAVLMLLIEKSEIGGESLRKPDVVPILFRGRIAEPLMRHLMGDELASGAASGVAIEDVAGELHASTGAVRLYLGELLVGVRADVVVVELED